MMLFFKNSAPGTSKFLVNTGFRDMCAKIPDVEEYTFFICKTEYSLFRGRKGFVSWVETLEPL